MVFNVIIFNVNSGTFTTIDVLPYFKEQYLKLKKDKRPFTFNEFKEFVTKEGKYRYWSRCEYEIVLVEWPYNENKPMERAEKIDVWSQINNNLDAVVRLLMYNLNIDRCGIRY